MCFNKETSLGIFIFGLMCALYLQYRGLKNNNILDKYSSIVTFLISNMQLIEFFIWKYQECNMQNQITSLFLIIILYLQPIIFYLWISFYNLNSQNREYVVNILILIYSIIFIILFNNFCKNITKICSLADDSARLTWGPIKYMYEKKKILGIILLILYFAIGIIGSYNTIKFKYIFHKHFILICIIISIIICLVIEKNKENFINIFGSLWCFMAVFFGFFSIILN